MTIASHPRILAVEDNAETRLLLQHLLKDDFEATIVSHVDAAVETVADAAQDDQRFDVLLLDINLSDRHTGTDLLHMLRERHGMNGVPAVAMTAYAMPGDRESFLSEGFDQYVGKPFTRADLMGALHDVLDAQP